MPRLRSLALLVASTAVLLLVALLPVRAGPLEIGYQIHSQDDLRQWPQSLLKAGDAREIWMKIDFYYALADFCRNATYDSVARVNPKTAHLGCFLLNHDTPTPHRSAPYNTSDDVLAMLADSSFAPWFLSPPRKVSIALCSKFDPPVCDGSQVAQDYLALMDDFFERAEALIADKDLQVEFILDGALTPNAARSCLAQRWRPWNATYIIDSDPPSALFDNNATNGDDRFQINNMNFLGLPHALDDQYGKFGLQQHEDPANRFTKDYPFLLWEPADQFTITLDVALYLAGPRHNADEAQGFRFAINSDPVQLQVHAGSLSGAAWNWPLSDDAPEDRTPRVAVWAQLPDSQTKLNTESLAMLTAYWSGAQGGILYRLHQFQHALAAPVRMTRSPKAFPVPARFGNPSTMFPSFRAVEPREQLRLGVAGGSETPLLQRTALFVADDAGNFAVLDASSLESSRPFVAEGTLPLPSGASFSRIGMAVAPSSDSLQPSKLTLLQATAAADCALLVRYFSASGANASSIWYSGNNFDVCVMEASGEGVQSPTDAVIALTTLQANAATPSPSAAQCGGQWLAHPVEYAVLLTYSINGVSFASHGCLTTEAGLKFWMSQPAVVAVGDSPSVSLSLAPQTGAPFVALTFSNSYCWNSEFTNKRPTPALCDSTPNSQTGILSYAVGSWSSLADLIAAGAAAASSNATGVWTGLSPCGRQGDLVHGSHDMGADSTITLFAGPASFEERTQTDRWSLQVVEAHAGFQSAATQAAQRSGSLATGGGVAAADLIAAATSSTSPAALLSSARVLSRSDAAVHLRSQATTPAGSLRALFPADAPVPAEECGSAIEHAGIVIDAWKLPF